MRRALTISLLMVLVCACAGAEAAPPEEAKKELKLLVPIYFYQGHSVGKESRPTGLHIGDPDGSRFECVTWPELITNSVAVDESGRWIYLACGNGLMVSADAGQNWRLAGGSTLTEVQRVCIDSTSPRKVTLATAYGRDWRTFSESAEPAHEDESYIPNPLAGGVRFCSDIQSDLLGRGEWLCTAEGLVGPTKEDRPIRGVSVRRVLQDREKPERLLACTDGRGLMVSVDGGKKFARQKGAPDTVFCVAESPLDSEVLYVGTMEGLYVSRDGGETFESSGEGLPTDFYIFGIAPDPRSLDRVVVSGNDGLFESRDGGRTFQRLGFHGALIRDVLFAELADCPPVPPSSEPGSLGTWGEEEYPDECRVPDPGFESRREAVLDHFRKLPAPPEGRWMGFFRAAQMVKEGRADAKLWADVLEALEKPQHSMFFSMPLMGFYLHAKDKMPEEVADRIQEVMTTNPVYRGDTENHWVMHYAALLLATQAWPETPAATWYTGRSSREMHAEAYWWLYHWLVITARWGQGEFDSPNYLFMYVTPMLLLYDFGRSDHHRRMAGIALDLLLADYLSESLRGAYCGGHSRIIGREVELAASNRVSILHYLYAGGIPRPGKVYGWMPFAALSSYRPPSVLHTIANRRDGEWVQTEVKRVRNVIRFGKKRSPPVYKYDYMTPRYCLGSLQGGILQPIQQHTWDVTWIGSAENSTLFTVHPSVSARELAMFFPEDVRDLTRTITAQKGVYGSPDKLVSASPWEKVFQHENVLLAIYAVPPGEEFPHVTLYWPDCLERTGEKGWLFGRDGEFWMACFPCQEGEWKRWKDHSRHRCAAARAGFVVVTRKGEGSFEDFRKGILACPPPRLTGKIDAPTLSFVGPEGLALEATFGVEDGKVGGKVRPFPSKFLYRGPFIRSDYKSREVVLTDGETKRTLRCGEFEIIETTK